MNLPGIPAAITVAIADFAARSPTTAEVLAFHAPLVRELEDVRHAEVDAADLDTRRRLLARREDLERTLNALAPQLARAKRDDRLRARGGVPMHDAEGGFDGNRPGRPRGGDLWGGRTNRRG